MSRPAASLAAHRTTSSPVTDPDLLRTLRARLEMQRDFRIDQLAALRSMAPGTSVQDEIVDSLCRGATNALYETQQAMWRMDEGCYGWCTACGIPLGIGQLTAVPQAARCPACEQELQSP